MSQESPDLLGLTPEALDAALERHFSGRGQPGFRSEQVRGWVYDHRAASIGDMSNLPATEREALAEAFRLGELGVASVSRSRDGTVKHLWRTDDGELIESVLIPSRPRLTLCISSQAGCAMGCTFCATGWGGFRRHLSPGEIVAQFRASARWAHEAGYGRITNIVFMGMGEPLANRKALHPALTILNRGFGVGARRITVSTVGLVPGILELAERPEQFRLALSLHAPETELRRSLIPLEKRYPLPVLMDALRTFNARGGKRGTVEDTMISGVNDHLQLAPLLADMARELSAFVNLIPYNPIPDRDWVASSPQRMREFLEILESQGVSAEIRTPRGRDIDAACGQLRANALVQLDS